MKIIYVTTPIYYANDVPHIGHAYTTLAADIYCRWNRMQGRPAYLLTGTDEHGSKIAQAAAAAGKNPKEFLDETAQTFKNLWPQLNVHPDDFIRTTDERHIRGVQHACNVLYRKGDIYKGVYEGWYCIPDETFFTETQLIDGKCPECNRTVEKIKEESYFFRLSRYQSMLQEHYEKHPEFLKPESRALEIINFVASGLRDVSISRTRVPWGIPVPFDPKHTVYVWFDALLNYITAIGYDNYDKLNHSLWPADVQLVGKEIFKFHSIMWPAMLKALDLPLPHTVFAHGWWTVEGEKMSKSVGNVVGPQEIARLYSVDTLRYFLFREMPFGGDGNFTREALKRRYNTELANDLGNLFSRSVSMVEKYCGGAIPAAIHPEEHIIKDVLTILPGIDAHYAQLSYYYALTSLWRIIEMANKYIEQKAPWKIPASEQISLQRVLCTTVWMLAIIAVHIYPVTPMTAEEIWKRIGHTDPLCPHDKKYLINILSVLPAQGIRVHKGAALFPRK